MSDDDSSPLYVLQLYVAGATPHSMRAVKNCKRICDSYLHDNYSLKIIDVYLQPELAQSNNIIAAPTLLRLKPVPVRRLIGDLSETNKVLIALEIELAS